MMQVLHEIKLLYDGSTGKVVRELSPFEVDAISIHGDAIAEQFPLEGPSGSRYE